MLLLAALTLWDYVLAMAGAVVVMCAFLLFIVYGGRLAMRVVWRLLPNGRLKHFLFKERSRPEHSAINPLDPWVQAQWIKTPSSAPTASPPPPEFISGERADSPRTGTDPQEPASRR